MEPGCVAWRPPSSAAYARPAADSLTGRTRGGDIDHRPTVIPSVARDLVVSLATLGMTEFGRRRRYQLRSAHAAARAGRSSSEITAKNVGRASGGDSDARSGTTFFAALREEHAAVQQRCTAARRTMSSPVFGGQQVAIDGRATERHSSTIEVRAMN